MSGRLGRIAPLAAAGLALIGAGIAGGCGAFWGMAADTYLRTSTRTVEPEYDGLSGKSFAVVVSADRAIQSDHPGVVPLLTRNITKRLIDHCSASGVVPAEAVLKYQYENPRWVALHPAELAEELGGVQRLVYIELDEYALTEPGNPYLWSGVAAARISVLEADGLIADDFSFSQNVSVEFPDQQGYGPMDMDRRIVELALAKRFVDRASWLFYEHEEDYYPEY